MVSTFFQICLCLLMGGELRAGCGRPILFPSPLAGGLAARRHRRSFQIQPLGLSCTGSPSQRHGSWCCHGELQSGAECCCRRCHLLR